MLSRSHHAPVRVLAHIKKLDDCFRAGCRRYYSGAYPEESTVAHPPSNVSGWRARGISQSGPDHDRVRHSDSMRQLVIACWEVRRPGELEAFRREFRNRCAQMRIAIMNRVVPDVYGPIGEGKIWNS